MESSNQLNGFTHNCDRSGQKRERDRDDEMDNDCLPISKRITRLSLDTSQAHMGVATGWPVAGGSHQAAPPAPAGEHLHMPLLMGGPNGHVDGSAHHLQHHHHHHQSAAPAGGGAPSAAPLAAEPDLSPEECPQYYHINSYLYQLHLERLRRLHGQL